MKTIYFFCCILCAIPSLLTAQMPVNGGLRYGNEWIRYDQPYFKILIANDGMYRVPFEALSAQGIDVNNIGSLQLYYLGEQVPIHVGTNFIEFYARRNRSELDQYLYRNGRADMLNPEYSMITDTSAYFLTVARDQNTQNIRYQSSVNDLTNLPPREEWFWGEIVQDYKGVIAQPQFDKVNESAFDRGEGYANSVTATTPFDFRTTPPQRFAGNIADSLEIRFAGIGANSHRIQINVNDNLIDSVNSFTYQFWHKTYAVNRSGSPEMLVRLVDQTGQLAVGVVRLKYARLFNFNNQTSFYFKISTSAEPKYLEIENFNRGNVAPILYDLTNQLRIETIVDAGKIKIKLPPSAKERELILVSYAPNVVPNLTNLLPVRFTDYANANAEYLIISSERLRRDAQGKDWVQEYAAYRASAVGGNYDTLVVNVENLYDQFAYGIHRHPLSIRNFVHFAKARWRNPRYLLVIGKGSVFTELRSSGALNARQNIFYVPTLGFPGADNLLAATNENLIPVVSVGRIAATKPEEIAMYLEKVQQYEDINMNDDADRAWRKQIILLGGGSNPSEQSSIRRYIQDMENIISTNAFGARVNTFFKTSVDPIQQASSTFLNGLINKGAAVITLFGHAGTDTFDFSVDDPSSYENEKRYHVLISLSCYNGDYHYTSDGVVQKSASENFIFQEKKGAIAFLATTGFGLVSTLGDFQKEYYRQLGDAGNYGRSLGDLLRSTAATFSNRNNLGWRAQLQQFSIHGDPAIVIMPFDAPDYVIEKNSLNFEAQTINTLQDSFSVKFKVLNIGKNLQDSILLEIDRELPDGARFKALQMRIPAPRESSEHLIQLPTLGTNAVGKNHFYFTLNNDNRITEAPLPRARDNNRFYDVFNREGASVYITSNSAIAVNPLPYAIVSGDLKLQASTINSQVSEQKYIFEIDTTAHFNSPFKIRYEASRAGGLIEWSPSLILRDSTVYYWRVSPDSTDQIGYFWNTSSFTYLRGSAPGWSQSHHFQMQGNRLSNMEIPESTRRQQYASGEKTVRAITGSFPQVFPKGFIGLSSYEYQRWRQINGLYIFVINGSTGVEWINQSGGDYGSNAEWSTAAFPFSTNFKDSRRNAINFLKNVVNPRDYVLIFTVQNNYASYSPEQWAADSVDLGTNLFKILEQQGADSIRTLATLGSRPYMFFYKKDDPSFTPTERMAEPGQVLDVTAVINGTWESGSITSTTIGPAKRWASLHWQETLTDAFDQSTFELYGVRADSSQTLLVTDLAQFDTTLHWIQADSFPLLRLRYASEDKTARTAPQLNAWRVLYEGLPDAALVKLPVPKDTLQQGEEMLLEFPIANVSPYDMDSLLVRFTFTDVNNNKKVNQKPLRPLLRQDTLLVRLPVNTRDLQGKQILSIEINPDKAQPELYTFNNNGFVEFYVGTDRRNPLLDVTFDGIKILNGDLVSPKPLITIELQDENQYLPLNDPALFSVFLDSPNPDNPLSPIKTQLKLNSEQVQFFAPTSADKRNKARIEWKPEFTQSGKYALTVQARDIAGNAAGQLDYKIDFEVITESKLSNVLNYPNPFSTSTRFVYTLTGDAVPQDYMIQIMTVSGRIVRELTQDDLGPLKIGTHQTEFAWDGTDAYGNRLANGVYLYRMLAKDQNGKEFAKYDNGTDRFFKNGIGKLVILR
ncbi:MAG: C25 family cysteine peptidase [Saprospiraceae bacterium]